MFKLGNMLQKQSNSDQYIRFPVLITAFFVLMCVSIFILFGRNGGKYYPFSYSMNSAIKLDATVEYKNGTNLIWQIPDMPRAILFISHGCYRTAKYFWDKSSKCPNCVGLPIEKGIVIHALARKFAVLIISSVKSCPTHDGQGQTVKDIINWWVAKQNLENLPLVALGISSGATFLSLFATNMQFSSITLMISEGEFDKIDNVKGYPPTFFVVMPKDRDKKLKTEKNLVRLKENGVDVAKVECIEFSLSPQLLADRIQGLNLTTSVKVFKLFQDKGYVNKSGYVTFDPRSVQWNVVGKEFEPLLPDVSLLPSIREQMNLAWAFHETTNLKSDQIFNWFESHMNK